jgi:hypothetical protein
VRKDCVFSTLTEEQQADLFDWLTADSYEVVLKRIAQPPPDGFGIKSHINSLVRFYAQRHAQIRARDLSTIAAAQSGPAAQPFFNAAATAFAHSTYILAHSPLTPTTYRALSRSLHQNEDISVKREYLDVARQHLALSRERLQFDRAQFEYNAARAALAILPELIAIDQLTGIDDEAKIWRVRDRLFGSSPMPNEKCSMITAQCPDPEGEAPNEPHTNLK